MYFYLGRVVPAVDKKYIMFFIISVLYYYMMGTILALIDTHVFKLNEYFVELNPANFKVLNQILN